MISAAEIIATTGYDWMLVDGEHAPNTVPTLLGQLQAVAPYATHPVVRAVQGDTVLIKQLLDVGVQTLMVPMVETAEQALAPLEDLLVESPCLLEAALSLHRQGQVVHGLVSLRVLLPQAVAAGRPIALCQFFGFLRMLVQPQAKSILGNTGDECSRFTRGQTLLGLARKLRVRKFGGEDIAATIPDIVCG